MYVQVLGAEEYGGWVEERREAEVALDHREEKLFASAKAIESQLELLGESPETESRVPPLQHGSFISPYV